MVYDRRFLRSLVIYDQKDRLAHSGDPRLPEWCVAYDIYYERQSDLLVAGIFMAKLLRQMGPEGLAYARDLKPAWNELYDAWQQRDVEKCRSHQVELMRRRHRYFGDDMPYATARLRPKSPVHPVGQAQPLPR